MCHFSCHSNASHLPGLYSFSALPLWQWGAVPCLSALNHRDRLELGCPEMVAFTSQKHKWRSHLHCTTRYFLQPPFLEAIFFPLQQKTINEIMWNCAYLWDMCVCVLKGWASEQFLDTPAFSPWTWNREALDGRLEKSSFTISVQLYKWLSGTHICKLILSLQGH